MLLTKLEERSVPRVLQARENEEPEAAPAKANKSLARFFLPKRLFFQTIVVSTVLVTLAIVGFSAHIVRDEIEVGMERLVLDAVVLTKNIALVAAAQFETGARETTEKLLLQSAAFEQVERIEVTDSTGLLLHRVLHEEGAAPKLQNKQMRLPVPLKIEVAR